MTRITKKSLQHTAIILCIFIILTSACSFVLQTDISDGDTQFFAAGFFDYIHPYGRQSLSSSGVSHLVSWLRPSENVSDKQLITEPENIFSESNNDILSDNILLLDSICITQGSNRKYYLRI